MLHLYVMRHAKSSWAIPGQADFDRGLNERGESDLPRLADHIRENSISPSLVFCSTAARTRATLAGIEDALGGEHETRFADELYHGTTETYLGHVNSANTDGPVMIIGHNPSCELLVNRLTGKGSAEALSEISTKYPTGCIAHLQFETDAWSKVTAKSGYLVSFTCPRTI